jgi:hypothetical protein
VTWRQSEIFCCDDIPPTMIMRHVMNIFAGGGIDMNVFSFRLNIYRSLQHSGNVSDGIFLSQLGKNKVLLCPDCDRLCGLVVRVPSYRSRGPGFDSRGYQFF